MQSQWEREEGGEAQSEGDGIGMAIGNVSSAQSPRAKRDFLCNEHPPPLLPPPHRFSYNGLTIRNAGDRPFVPLSEAIQGWTQ